MVHKENKMVEKAGKVNKPISQAPKIGGDFQGGALTPDQQRIARGILTNYDLKNIDSPTAQKIQTIFTSMGIGEPGLRWALQDAGADVINFFSKIRTALTSTNLYVMTDAVKNGINVREKATSESKLLYMLVKVDATHPVISITKLSDDKYWGFMETGDKNKNGWIYMEYVKHY
jgi:hypothetical protein